MRPPDKERRPPGQEKAADQDAHGGGIGTTVPPRRCMYLHPTHLTGCRQPAEPGSVYCARHEDGAR
jgi:hypothetical protein